MVWRWGKTEIIYLSLHCHHQNDSCTKMGSDESHFNDSLIARDKVTRQCICSINCEGQSHRTMSTNHKLSEEKEEPKRNQTEVLLFTSLTPYRYAVLLLARKIMIQVNWRQG